MGDVDLAELAHPLFAFLLLIEEFAFAGHVAAVAFGEDVLAQGLDGLAGDDAAADRGLDGDLEKLARDQVLQPLAQRAAAAVGLLRWTIIDSASTGSPLTRMFISTRSPSA